MNSRKKHQLLSQLEDYEFKNITKLAQELQWPRTTLVYYINALLEENLIIKEHGNISKRELIYETKTKAKLFINAQKKKAIAKQASTFINDGDIIYVDSGSTTLFLLDFIKHKAITIYTNNILLIEKLPMSNFVPKIFIIPGEVYMKTSSIIGAMAISFLHKIFIDKAFLGVNSIINNEFITTNQEEAILKEMIFNKAQQAFILYDKSKINKHEGNYIYGKRDKKVVEVVL